MSSCMHQVIRFNVPPYRYKCILCGMKLKILSGVLVSRPPIPDKSEAKMNHLTTYAYVTSISGTRNNETGSVEDRRVEFILEESDRHAEQRFIVADPKGVFNTLCERVLIAIEPLPFGSAQPMKLVA
jgi:hypothetical protein